jgi:hypothetical protein
VIERGGRPVRAVGSGSRFRRLEELVRLGEDDVVGDRFVYRFWPIVDMVNPADGDAFVGRGLFLGVQFCRFRLKRMADAGAATRLPATGSGRSGTESSCV